MSHPSIYHPPKGISGPTMSPYYSVSLAGEPVSPVVFRDLPYLHLGLVEPVRIVVEVPSVIEYCNISPHRRNFNEEAGGRQLSLDLRPGDKCVLSINHYGKMVIFADGADDTVEDPPPTDVLNVGDQAVDPSGRTVQTALYQSLIHQAAAEGQLLYFPPGRYRTGSLAIDQPVEIRLAGGALIEGPFHKDDFSGALFDIRNTENVRLTGLGALDANGEQMRSQGARGNNVLSIEDCRNVVVEGLLLRNPGGWNTVITRSVGVTFRNIKVLNDTNVFNTDGINPNSSCDITIADCFLYAGDDPFAVKTVGTPPSENISILNNVVITKKTAMKIGTESHGDIRDVLFQGNDIIEADRAFAIYNRDGGTIENIRFIDNNVEEFIFNYQQKWLYVQISERHGKGIIRNAMIKDCAMETESRKPGRVHGLDDEHTVSGLTFDNVTIKGRRIQSRKDANLDVNEFVRDLQFN